MNLFAAGNRQRKMNVQGDDKASIKIDCQKIKYKKGSNIYSSLFCILLNVT